MKNRPTLFAMVFTLCFLFSCEDINTYHKILLGNNAFNKGLYQEASYNYFLIKNDERYQDVVNYNLGNVYYALGFDKDAMSRWSIAESSKNQDLRFCVAYNLGVKNYEDGNYQTAFDYFRKAIIIEPVRFKKANLQAAKINLQLCLDKIQISEKYSTALDSVSVVKTQSQKSDKYLELMKFIEKKEEIEWNVKQNHVPTSVEDY